jgi:hypothetical protein
MNKGLRVATEDNPIEYINHQEIFLTRESIEKQMPLLWGCQDPPFKWLPTRFYFYLSGNMNLKRIYFGDYLDKLYKPLF